MISVIERTRYSGMSGSTCLIAALNVRIAAFGGPSVRTTNDARGCGKLGHREVDVRLFLFREADVLDAADNADDRQPLAVARGLIRLPSASPAGQ